MITGVRSPTKTKIVVVDLDGPEALEAWHRITSQFRYAPNKGWISTTGSGGRHHYFLLPDDAKECPSGILWGLYDTWGWGTGSRLGSGGWCKHKEIRLLGDNSLVVAPPSLHVDTGRRYEFDETASPKVHRLPEPAPSWLLALPRLMSPRFTAPEPPRPRPQLPVTLRGNPTNTTHVRR